MVEFCAGGGVGAAVRGVRHSSFLPSCDPPRKMTLQSTISPVSPIDNLPYRQSPHPSPRFSSLLDNSFETTPCPLSNLLPTDSRPPTPPRQ